MMPMVDRPIQRLSDLREGQSGTLIESLTIMSPTGEWIRLQKGLTLTLIAHVLNCDLAPSRQSIIVRRHGDSGSGVPICWFEANEANVILN